MIILPPAYLRPWDDRQGFEEGELTFAPTYKYIAGQDIYDQRPEKKMRCPAWCDRVLWKVRAPWNLETVTQLQYRRGRNIISDHKPVQAVFDIQVRSIDPMREMNVLGQIHAQKLEYLQNEFALISCAPNHVWFSGVGNSEVTKLCWCCG